MNHIKYMNGALFAHSPNIRLVNLHGNVCIDEKFNDDSIIVLSDEVTKQCGTIDEPLLVHFIDQCSKRALKSESELSACKSVSERTSKESTLTNIHEKLVNLTNSQLLQKKILEKFVQDEKHKELQIKSANEKLQKAEAEIMELKKQLETK